MKTLQKQMDRVEKHVGETDRENWEVYRREVFHGFTDEYRGMTVKEILADFQLYVENL